MQNTTKFKLSFKLTLEERLLIETESIDVEAIIKAAKTSNHKEAYQTIVTCPNYRIGVGARIDLSDDPHFFLEVLINLSGNSSEFDLSVLEKSVTCLKTLHARGYALTYEDAHWVSCETKLPLTNPKDEFLYASSLLKSTFIR